MFEWVDKNTDHLYTLKTDEDSFPKLDQIEQELSERHTKRPLYWGMIVKNYIPFNEGQWKEIMLNLCDKYLPYALGAGYVLSRSLKAFSHWSLNAH